MPFSGEKTEAADTASPSETLRPPSRPHRARFLGLAPLLAACLWGGMYVVSRASFSAIPPITLGLLRVIIGGLTLWLALKLTARREQSRQEPPLVAPPSRRPPVSQSEPNALEMNAGLEVAGNPRRRVWWPQAPSRDFNRQAGVRPNPLRGDIWRFLLLGGTLTATLITQFWGTALASAHDGALLTTMTPVFVVPIAWLFLHERPGWRVLAGMGLALAGVLIVVGANIGAGGAGASGLSLLGDALLLISALCWALFTVLGAPLVRRLSALVTSTYATLWCIVLVAPFALIELTQRSIGTITPGLILAVLYLGWGATALAWFLWYKGVEHLDAAVAAVFFFAQPLVGGLLSALFLGETLSSGFWLGGAVLAGGIVLASIQKRSQQEG